MIFIVFGGIFVNKKLLLIDGNSIMNRAFYGIMGNKMLSTKDRKIYQCCIWIFSNFI